MTFKNRLLTEDLGNHLKNNWGKYAAGTGAGLAASVYGDEIKDAVQDYTADEPALVEPAQPVEPAGPTAAEKAASYSKNEKELLGYMKNELPLQSVSDVDTEVSKHTELPWWHVGEKPQVQPTYNTGEVNARISKILEDPTNMSRAQASKYVDTMYDNMSGKNNEYMDYGDENQGKWAKVKDYFGRAETEGKFNDTYMKNLDDKKEASIEKIIALRDKLKLNK